MGLVWFLIFVLLVSSIGWILVDRIKLALDQAYERGFRDGAKFIVDGNEMAGWLMKLDEELDQNPPRQRRKN